MILPGGVIFAIEEFGAMEPLQRNEDRVENNLLFCLVADRGLPASMVCASFRQIT
jgi:hypothetical protein